MTCPGGVKNCQATYAFRMHTDSSALNSSAQKIVQNALQRVDKQMLNYAYPGMPTSPYPSLSGNKVPGKTQIRWLKGHPKCNQFIGDVMTDSGFQMPTFRMKDNTKHYMNAERLPGQEKYFDRVKSLDEIQPGDIFVLDHPRPGEDGAHTEIVVSIDTESGNMFAAGARKAGAYIKDQSALLEKAKNWNPEGYWEWQGPTGKNKLFFLRPKLPISSIQ